jgi:hypothetical protein
VEPQHPVGLEAAGRKDVQVDDGRRLLAVEANRTGTVSLRTGALQSGE